MTPSATDKLKKVPLDTTVSEIVEGGLASVPASKVSGTLSTSNIPSLDASKITSGTLSSARIPSLATSKITSGTFADARIPSLAATKITSGTFASARLPVATSTAKGAVMPVAKTTDMTQSVGVDSYGKLYTKPASGGVTKIVAGSNVTISPTTGTGEVTISASGGGASGHTVTIRPVWGNGADLGWIRLLKSDGSVELHGTSVAMSDVPSISGTSFVDIKDEGQDIPVSNVIGYMTGSIAGTSLSLLNISSATKVASVLSLLKPVTSDMTVEVSWGCIVKGSEIALYNGGTKKIEDVTYEDDLLVYSFDSGILTHAKPLWVKRAHAANYKFHCVFYNGKVLDITGRSSTGWGHRGFNVTRQKFTYFPASVGDDFFMQDGSFATLVSCTREECSCEYYNIITDKHYNCFANGILTSCSLNNVYPIRDALFVKEHRTIRPISEFGQFSTVDGNPVSATEMSKWYNGLRLGEQTGDAQELHDYVQKLIKSGC